MTVAAYRLERKYEINTWCCGITGTRFEQIIKIFPWIDSSCFSQNYFIHSFVPEIQMCESKCAYFTQNRRTWHAQRRSSQNCYFIFSTKRVDSLIQTYRLCSSLFTFRANASNNMQIHLPTWCAQPILRDSKLLRLKISMTNFRFLSYSPLTVCSLCVQSVYTAIKPLRRCYCISPCAIHRETRRTAHIFINYLNIFESDSEATNADCVCAMYAIKTKWCGC